MSIEEKIESDYKKLKSLKIAQDIINIINDSGGKTSINEMVNMLNRVVREEELEDELKKNITLKIHKEIFGDVVVPYIKETKKGLGIE